MLSVEDRAASAESYQVVTKNRALLRHWRWFRHKIKHLIGGVVNRHPYLWYAAWGLMPRFNFLLPHEKSYYAFRHLARPTGGLFLDVGANNGLSARGVYRLLPHYEIFSIEANEQHRGALERLKRRLPKFDYRIAAAGADNATLMLHMATYRNMHLHTGVSANLEYLQKSTRAAFPSRTWKHLHFTSFSTPVIKLDELKLIPDLIKIDVEGYDIEVLRGLTQTITANRPAILVEFDSAIIDKLRSFCDEHTYSIYLYDDLGDRFKHFEPGREDELLVRSGASPTNMFLIPTEIVDGLPLADG